MTITTDFVRLNAVLTKTVPSYAATQAATSTASLNSLFQDLYGNSTAANTQAAIQIAANLGLTGELADIAQVYIATQLNAASYADRGDVLAILASYLAETPAGNAYKATADAFNTAVTAAETQVNVEGFAGGVFSLTPVTPPNEGQTFTLKAGLDELVGTSRDDLFLATAQSLTTNDEIDGGAGNDVLRITATANVSSGDVTNIETVEFVVRAPAAVTLDADLIDDAVIRVSNAGSGFSTSATVSNAGENEIVAGSGITGTLTVLGNDEALINVGSAATLNLGVSAANNELNFAVTATSNTAVTEAAGNASTADTIIVSGAGGTLDISASTSITAATDITINGARLIVDIDQIDGAGLEISGGGQIAMEASRTSSATLDLEDSSDDILYVINALSTNTLALDNADGKRFLLNTANATSALTIDTSGDDEPGVNNFTVDVRVAGTALAIGTNAEEVSINLIAAAASTFTALDINGATDVFLDIGSVNFAATSASLNEGAAIGARLFIEGSGRVTLTNLDLSYVDASNVTGPMIVTPSSTTFDQELKTGSGNDIITLTATGSRALDIESGAGDDIINLTAHTTNGGQVVVDGGAGDDRFILGTADASFVANDNIVLIGGDGNDEVVINFTAFGAAVATMSTTAAGSAKVFFGSDIEIITLASTSAGTLDLAIDQFSGETFTVRGTSTSGNETLRLSNDANDTALDISGIVFEETLDALVINLGTALAATIPSAQSLVASSFDETINLTITNIRGISIDAGAGDDEIDADTVNTGVVTVTLGEGDDVLDLAGATSTRAFRFVVTDYEIGADTIDFGGIAVAGNTATSVNVSGVVNGAAPNSLQASIVGGKVSVVGSALNLALLDTLDEWIDVVEAAAGANPRVVSFEFGGSTFVVETTNATTSANVVELVGITGVSLGASGGTNILIA